MTIKECAKRIADMKSDFLLDDIHIYYKKKYDQLIYFERKEYIKTLQTELNNYFDAKLAEIELHKDETIDELALLKHENEQLKKKIKELSEPNRWDDCEFSGGA